MSDKILIVDDNRDILTVLRANLELHGFAVLAAETGKDAAAILDESTPDLVVLDRMLPDCDGAELLNQWRQQERTVPVILLTARDSVSDRVLGLESGADDYVVKPFEPLELIARVKACLRRLKPEGKTVLSAGDFFLDRAAMRITLRGTPLELTPKEYRLLSLFLEHQGEVISRERIKKELWKNTKIYSWSRVIDVHIQHLRQKIEPVPSDPVHIRTVIGTGYMFEP